MSVAIFDASVALVVYQDKVLLMLRDDFPHIYCPNTWGMIGGGIDAGETPDQALIREAKEEANIEVKEYNLIKAAPHVKDTGRMNYLYVIKLSDADAKNVRLGDEGQKLEFFTLAEMKNLEVTHGIRDLLDNHFELLKKYITQP